MAIDPKSLKLAADYARMRREAQSVAPFAVSPNTDFTTARAIKDAYSLSRVLLGHTDGLEGEVSKELARVYGTQPSGMFIPLSALTAPMQRSDLNVGTSNLGGYTVETTTTDELLPYLLPRSTAYKPAQLSFLACVNR
jgi:hypothetical protein